MQPINDNEREHTTMPHGTYERIMVANTKEQLGSVIYALLSDHYPELYYGRGGNQYKYCPTCDTTNENTYYDEGCKIMQTIADYNLENYS